MLVMVMGLIQYRTGESHTNNESIQADEVKVISQFKLFVKPASMNPAKLTKAVQCTSHVFTWMNQRLEHSF